MRRGFIVTIVLLFLLAGGCGKHEKAQTKENVQQWHEGFCAEDYFVNSIDIQSESGVWSSDCYAGYWKLQDFSGERQALEMEEIIPVLGEYPEFSCAVHYSDEETIHHVSFAWNAYEEQMGRSYFRVNVGQMQWFLVDDYVCVNTSDGVPALAPTMTVTERDGVQIIAGGGPERDKLMIYEKDGLWYHIEVAWEDSYDDIVALMNWFFEHPVNMEYFYDMDS